MLLPTSLSHRIRSGEVTCAFRAWKRPTVGAGGTLQSPAGVLAIDEVTTIALADITTADARASGVGSVGEVIDSLRTGDDRTLYRIRFHHVGDDPRIALREDDRLDDEARAHIDDRLARWDRTADDGPWTGRVLDVIDRRAAVVSTELAAELAMERPVFKRRVRQLKTLGLTESLERGYRLSPRGEAYVDHR